MMRGEERGEVRRGGDMKGEEETDILSNVHQCSSLKMSSLSSLHIAG